MTPEERDRFWNEVPDPPRHYDRLGVGISMAEWADLREDPDYYRIGSTTIAERWWVSTVWLGIDHGWGWLPGRDGPYVPIIFETMVFDHGPDVARDDRYRDYEQERYSTEGQAREGHERMVQLVMTLEAVTGRVDS
jgi:hypothetical protein